MIFLIKKLSINLLIAIIILANLPSSGFAASKNLSVTNYSQEKSNWCWVTGGQIVIRYLTGTYINQCNLYKAGKNISTCTANQGGGFYADMARVLQRGDVHVGYVTTTLPPMATIINEIDGNSPMLARLGWKNSNLEDGHMLVIRGYNTSGNYVNYVYPMESSSYADKTSEYRTSTWSSLKENSSSKLTHTRYQMD